MKRKTEIQLTKDMSQADEIPNPEVKASDGTFKVADPSVLAQRKIFTAKRTHLDQDQEAEKIGFFAGLSAPAPSAVQVDSSKDDSRLQADAKREDADEANAGDVSAPTGRSEVERKPASSDGTENPTERAAIGTNVKEMRDPEGTKETPGAAADLAHTSEAFQTSGKTTGKESAQKPAGKEDSVSRKAEHAAQSNGVDKKGLNESWSGPNSEKRAFSFGQSNPSANGQGFSFSAVASEDKPFSFSVPALQQKESDNATPPLLFQSSQPASNAQQGAIQKLRESAVSNGEEMEQAEFRSKAKLYELEGTEKVQWKERGVGQLKLNVGKDSKSARLIMRSEGSLRLILNANLYEDIRLDKANERSVRFSAFDGDMKPTNYLIRLPLKEDLSRLMTAVDDWRSGK
ncbi:hypothetical protein NDN08_001009 [Rhodosorus marinus]|uniref:RanBD1 domain-containing protein n=1 Tax=Rhodosorus marinus TaxID=101924 RepID=A0AAV8UPQ8_9RHOD|nr:hypothetical protein NDN08_001009 [Rhodosorus marinus]